MKVCTYVSIFKDGVFCVMVKKQRNPKGRKNHTFRSSKKFPLTANSTKEISLRFSLHLLPHSFQDASTLRLAVMKQNDLFL